MHYFLIVNTSIVSGQNKYIIVL